jgi:hypothetical protein
MAIRPWDSFKVIVGSYASKGFFLFLRLFFLLFRAISWKIHGIKDVVGKNKDLEKLGGEPVAQALSVVAWNKVCFLQPPSLRDFMLKHDEYVSLDYVTQHDHICLFSRQDIAVFGEGEPGQLLWHSDVNSFITIGLYMESKRLIIMRMSDFDSVCSKLPDPKNIIIMGNTARCGSTLLTQIYECSKKVVSYAEPRCLYELAVIVNEKGYTDDLMRLTRNVCRMLCRPIKYIPHPQGYLLKPTGPGLACALPIVKLYPDTKVFYLYRDMMNVTKSIYKLSFFLPTMRMTYIMSRISGKLVEDLFVKAGFPKEGANRTMDNDHTCGVWQAAIATINCTSS